MKRNNKKGFTIVELVIVIAVIAILAAVMIPTFGGIIKKANLSSVQQAATSAYKEAYALAISDGEIKDLDANDNVTGEDYTVNGYTFVFTGTIDKPECEVTAGVPSGYTVTIANGQVTVKATN